MNLRSHYMNMFFSGVYPRVRFFILIIKKWKWNMQTEHEYGFNCRDYESAFINLILVNTKSQNSQSYSAAN